MTKLKMKINAILTQRQQKYQLYHLEKLINMNILQVKKILPSGQSRIIEEAKFKFFPISKAFERQMNTTEEKRKKNKLKL